MFHALLKLSRFHVSLFCLICYICIFVLSYLLHVSFAWPGPLAAVDTARKQSLSASAAVVLLAMLLPAGALTLVTMLMQLERAFVPRADDIGNWMKGRQSLNRVGKQSSCLINYPDPQREF